MNPASKPKWSDSSAPCSTKTTRRRKKTTERRGGHEGEKIGIEDVNGARQTEDFAAVGFFNYLTFFSMPDSLPRDFPDVFSFPRRFSGVRRLAASFPVFRNYRFEDTVLNNNCDRILGVLFQKSLLHVQEPHNSSFRHMRI